MNNAYEIELTPEQKIIIQNDLLEFIRSGGDKGISELEVDEWFENYDFSKLP
jgi:hypothetical protein